MAGMTEPHRPSRSLEIIDTRQLRAFQLLAQTGSFTAAGKAMFVTQSAVSHSLKALETSLGCSLIDRSGKRVALTAEGEALLVRANRILDEMAKAGEELRTMGRWGYGRLRIGATSTLCQYLLPAVLREFRESFPHCEVAIRTADTHELIGHLHGGDIDLAIAMRPEPDEPGIASRPLFIDHLVFAVSPLHPWAAGGGAPEETYAEQRYAIYSRRSPTYRLFERHMVKGGVTSPQVIELGNMEAIKELAKIDVGVGVVPPWMIRDAVAEGSLVMVEPKPSPLTRQWELLTRGRGSDEGSIMLETFAGICQTVSRELGETAGRDRPSAVEGR